jgi:hypothetical protein
MILALFGDEIRDLLFLALRLMAALGGFLLGWFFTGPIASLTYWILSRRSVPQWALYWAKLAGGILVALLVFWFLPLGMGGGGGGSGGGTGKGIGPGKGDSGAPKASGKGEGTGEVKKTSDDKGRVSGTASEILTIEMLGGDAVKDGDYYLIARKPPAFDAAALGKRLDELRPTLAGIDIVLTDQSVGESHQAVRLLVQMAQDRKLRSRILMPGATK